MPIVADAAVAVRGDMSKFAGDIKQGAAKPIQGLGAQIKSTLNPAALIGGGIALIGGAVVAGLAGAAKSLMEIERLNAQTDATLRSTGGAANVTREQVEELAEAAERATTIERESVQQAANMLLTFTKVRNEVGEGNDIFNQATEAAMDMSVALGTDLTSAAMLVGKALNDPLKGMTAMTRAGIQFTDQQKAMIKSLVESGDLLGAQTIILAELETQFGGSAEAFANTTAGKIQRFQNDMGNFFEGIILGAGNATDQVGDAADLIAIHFGDMGDRANRLADTMGISFEELKNQVRTHMGETGASLDASLASIEERFNETESTLPASMQATMDSMAATVYGGAVPIEDEFVRLASVPTAALEAEYQSIRAAAYQSTVEYAKGLMDGQNLPGVAFDAAMQIIEDEMSKEEESAKLHGQLVTLNHALGIAASEGKTASVVAINGAIAVITARLQELGVDAYRYGFNVAAELARGMKAGKGLLVDPAHQLSNVIRGQVGIESEPSDPSSGLRGITKWGRNIAAELAAGMLSGTGSVGAAAGMLAATAVPSFGAAAFPMAAGGAAGATINYNLYVEGNPKAVGSTREALSAWDQMAGFSDRSMT